MKYAVDVDFDINTFEFWGGACLVMEQVRREDLLEDVAACIESRFGDELPTASQINAYVLFDLEDDLWQIYEKVLWPKH